MGGSVVAFIATYISTSISTTKLGRPEVGLVPRAPLQWPPAPPYNGPPRLPTMAPRAPLQWPPAPPYNEWLAASGGGGGGGRGGLGRSGRRTIYIYNILLVSTSPQWKYKGKLAGLCSPHVRPTFAPPLHPSGNIRGSWPDCARPMVAPGSPQRPPHLPDLGFFERSASHGFEPSSEPIL